MKKTLTMILSLALVAALSIAGTLAYLTSTTQKVSNTFTVGDGVTITLDEAPVDASGKETDGARVTANNYPLTPGGSYDKDPTVHVNGDSCYLFVTVKNSLAGYEGDNTIAAQMTTNGWVNLGKTADGADVYALGSGTVDSFTFVEKSNGDDQVLFEELTISSAIGDTIAFDAFKTAAANPIDIKGYAIQSANMGGVSVSTMLTELGLTLAA